MDAHNLDDSLGEINRIGARILKTVKGIGFLKFEIRAETVGGTIPKEMNSVANDWVKIRSLRVPL